jgi:hypothetical protein
LQKYTIPFLLIKGAIGISYLAYKYLSKEEQDELTKNNVKIIHEDEFKKLQEENQKIEEISNKNKTENNIIIKKNTILNTKNIAILSIISLAGIGIYNFYKYYKNNKKFKLKKRIKNIHFIKKHKII